MSRLEEGTSVPFVVVDKIEEIDLAIAIAAALRTELRSRAVAKTVARWTGVSDRAVKKWLSGRAVPGGRHLVILMRHSDAVLSVVLRAAGRG